MWTKTTVVLKVMLVFGLFNSICSACDFDWFGSACQYKCHCGDCYYYHGCPRWHSCDAGWFGPDCQYVNLASNGTTSLSSLTDNDEFTCINVKKVSFSFTKPEPFTWMRVHVRYPDQIPNFQLHFKPHDNDSIIHCENLRNASVTDRSLDIHCDLDVDVDEVILEGDEVQSLCSVYISGGRNVALKQNTSQSSIHEDRVSEGAVNGNTLDDSTCTHTANYDPNPTWNLTFTQPKLVKRYVLYNRLTKKSKCCPERLKGFVLQSFTETGSRVFYYRDKDKDPQIVYNVSSSSVKQPISHVMIQATMSKSDKIILTLCEVEMFGDSVCPDGKYGFECEKTCNCAKKDKTCFVSTGLCPSGCAPGFYGENCDRECQNGKYGAYCLEDCSVTCISNFTDTTPVCRSDNGHCLQGCLDGYEGGMCETLKKDDDTGFYVGIGILCVLLLIAIIVIIIGGVMFRRLKRSQTAAGFSDVGVTGENAAHYRSTYKDANDYDLPSDHGIIQDPQTTQDQHPETANGHKTKKNGMKVKETIPKKPKKGHLVKDTANTGPTNGKGNDRKSDSEQNYENQVDVVGSLRPDETTKV